MKQIILSLSILLLSANAFAEGFQVNLQSAKQTGMGHTGAALRLGAEGMHFNPASLVYINKMDFSVGASGVLSNVDYRNDKGYTATSDNSMSTPLYLYAGFSLIKERLAVGVSFTTPYGSSMTWGDNWAGSSLVQNIALKSYMFQPTVSVKVAEGLTFGAGLMVATGSFELSRGLLPAGSLAFTGGYADVTPLSVKLNGNSSVQVGYNLGVMYEFSEKMSIGLSYRSKVTMKVAEGEAQLRYIDRNAEQIINNLPGVVIPPINNASFSSELPLPSNLTIGIAYKPIEKLTLAFDMQYTGWSAYEKLDVDFNEVQLKPFNMSVAKNYTNTMSYRLGGSYEVSRALEVRAGVYYDPTPVRSTNYNPETPGANKTGISAGMSYRPCERLSIDLALLYINGADTYGEYSMATPVTPTAPAFTGHYKSTAFVPSIGLGYKF